LRKSGALEKLNGLIIGGMTELEDTDIPFGMRIEDLILAHFQYRQIPICFDFPAGHIADNRALVLGAEVALEIENNQVTLSYLK